MTTQPTSRLSALYSVKDALWMLRTAPRALTALMLVAGLLLTGCDDSPVSPESSPSGTSATATTNEVTGSGGGAINRDASIFIEGVALRPGVTVNVHVRKYVNEDMPCKGGPLTGFAVHGVTATASQWERYVEGLFAERKLCRMYAVDMPGHGKSSLPEGDLLFGELTLQDFRTTILAALDHLRSHNIRPGVTFGHSQGTLLTMMTQQALRDAGTNLRSEYGVRHAVLLAPVPPRGLPWSAGEAAAEAVPNFVRTTDKLGTHVFTTPEEWLFLWFANPSGAFSSNTPSPQQVVDNGWASPEPLFSLLQLVGEDPFRKPQVDAGAFGDGTGTTAQVLHMPDDPWSSFADGEAIYQHLTGDATNEGLITVESEVQAGDAAHAMFVSEAGTVADETCTAACAGGQAPGTK